MIYENVVFQSENQKSYNNFDGERKREWVKDAVYEIKKQLFPRTDSKYLPEQISLLEGFIILSALEDGICKMGRGTIMEKLKRIRSMVFLRNNSIFAHGFGPVQKVDYVKFRNFVEEMFKNFCKIENIDFEKYLNDITWINPSQSVNYAKMEV